MVLPSKRKICCPSEKRLQLINRMCVFKNHCMTFDNLSMQILVDEMDRNDQLIGEVYNKGDILLQLIAGQSKSTIESQLNDLEEEWADFCQNTISVKTEVEDTLTQWTEYNENRTKLTEWLADVKNAHQKYGSASPDQEILREDLESNKVSLNDLSM